MFMCSSKHLIAVRETKARLDEDSVPIYFRSVNVQDILAAHARSRFNPICWMTMLPWTTRKNQNGHERSRAPRPSRTAGLTVGVARLSSRWRSDCSIQIGNARVVRAHFEQATSRPSPRGLKHKPHDHCHDVNRHDPSSHPNQRA